MPQYSASIAPRSAIESIADFQFAVAFESEGLYLDAETVKNGVATLFDEPHRGFYCIAVENNTNTIVGCLQVLREWSDWRNNEMWSVHSMYVLPEYRRQGVFRKLFEYAVQKAKEEKILNIRIPVNRTNTVGKAVCSALGLETGAYTDFILTITDK